MRRALSVCRRGAHAPARQQLFQGKRLVALSSTISARALQFSVGSRVGWADGAHWNTHEKAAAAALSLLTPSSPPINVTSFLEIARPEPVPPSVVDEPSSCENASNSSLCWSSSMPMPVSTTKSSRMYWPSSCLATLAWTTTSPTSVNLMALPTRLVSDLLDTGRIAVCLDAHGHVGGHVYRAASILRLLSARAAIAQRPPRAGLGRLARYRQTQLDLAGLDLGENQECRSTPSSEADSG